MPNRPAKFTSKTKGLRPITLADYSYGPAWKKLRDRRIQQDPLCKPCLDNGHTTPAIAVDHIKPRRDGGKDEWDNTQSICGPCHKAKTAEENRRWFKK